MQKLLVVIRHITGVNFFNVFLLGDNLYVLILILITPCLENSRIKSHFLEIFIQRTHKHKRISRSRIFLLKKDKVGYKVGNKIRNNFDSCNAFYPTHIAS